jgi:recombinational DNA repair protein RecR
MAYTPILSQKDSSTLRRIAWNYGLPMTKTIGRIMKEIVRLYPEGEICRTCRDKSQCETCIFSPDRQKDKK